MNHDDSKWANIQTEDPQFYETILEEINKDAKIYAEICQPMKSVGS